MRKIITTLLTTLTFSITTLAHAQISKVQTWNTDEGASVYLLEAKEIPIVDLIVAVNAGSAREGDKYGLASMTANMMTKGTGDLNEESFLIELDNLQSSINVGSSMLYTEFSLRTLSDKAHLDPSLKLFYDVIKDPQFDETIFKREIAQRIDSEKGLLDNPSALASELYFSTLYPKGLLGTTSEMLQQSLKALSIDDLKAFRDTHYNAQDAKIVFVGDIAKADAQAIAAKISALLGKGEALPKIANQTTDVVKTEKEKYFNSPQSQVILGQAGIDRFNEDYLPLVVGNHLLGGSGLTSMLMTTIREKDGLTYGIYSYFMPTMIAGPFTIRFSTKNESVDEAIDKTKALVAEFIENGPEADALQRAKNNFLGSLVLDLDSNAKLANAILGLASYNLPLDYYETLSEKVEAITPKEIQDAFKRHVNPDNFNTIIVGGYVENPESRK